ncbi:MAG: periplasmic heavy metal sensor [Terriglobales bacterium]|jgi:Spy/CpxP family protein refolding chaperone
MKKLAMFVIVLALGSSAFAQGPTPPNPADQTQPLVKYLTTVLSLTKTQQQQAKQLYLASATSEQTIHNNMRQAREGLRAAVKNNDSASIDEAANTIGQMTAQLESTHAKTDAALYQILTPEQQTKLSELQSQRGGPPSFSQPDQGPAMGFR